MQVVNVSHTISLNKEYKIFFLIHAVTHDKYCVV